MRRSLYASGGLHFALLLWVILGGSWFRDSEEPEFEVTGVTLVSVQDFEAMFEAPVVPVPQVVEQPAALAPTPEVTQPEAPALEETPPQVATPEATPEPPVETQPDVSALMPPPETQVQDQLAALPSPPASDPTAAPSDTPAPNEAPRVAPTPAPAPPPEVEIAPEVVTRPEPSDTPAPTPDTPATAPEEATTEIVTEAETPSASLAPVSSFRPPSRPIRTVAETPTPDVPPQVEERDPLADAIAAAVADAATETPPAPATPSGPPLSAAQQDGLRLAVQQCWNVGSLSSEALRTVVTIEVMMERDGRPQSGSIRLLESRGGSDAAAMQAFESARRAVIRCGASGYDLPVESYDHWRIIEITFNPEEMRLR